MRFPVVSFCISTFNRSEKVFELVNEILKYERSDIEVIVSDNCSTDNTEFKLKKIYDSRFHYYENKTNIGAIRNYLKVMTEGKGKYIFFCTDKDTIKASGISDLIQFFKSNPNIVAGYSSLDLTQKKQNLFFEQGFNSLKNIGYLTRHPTGYFFLSNELNKLNILDNYSEEGKVGSFPFEFILADLCMRGKTAIVNIPLGYMESMDDVKSIKSYSYSGKNENLYFTPLQRYVLLEKYINHIKSIILTDKQKKIIVKYVFYYGLCAATIGYNNIMKNKTVCEHYHIISQNLSFKEILKNGITFCKKFIKGCSYSNFINRYIICLETLVHVFNKIIFKSFVKIYSLIIKNQ